MQRVLKHSKQRDALLNIIKNVTNHPTADWLYVELKKEFPNISLATVYRNLNLLVGEGDIIRLDCGGDSERYDGNVKKHYHFMCRNCSEIKDVSLSYEPDFNELLEAGSELKIEDSVLFFYGLCEKCK